MSFPLHVYIYIKRASICDNDIKVRLERDAATERAQRLAKEVETLRTQLQGSQSKVAKFETAWKAMSVKFSLADSNLKNVNDRLETAQADAIAVRTQLKERDDKFEAMAAISTEEKDGLQQALDNLKRENDVLEKANRVLVQNISNLKREEKSKAAVNDDLVAALEKREEEIEAMKEHLAQAYKRLSTAKGKGKDAELKILILDEEKTALQKEVEASRAAKENVTRLQTELAQANAKVQAEKAAFADVVITKNKEMDDLEKAARASATGQSKKAQEHKEEVARLKDEVIKQKEVITKQKDAIAKQQEEVARHMQANRNIANTLADTKSRSDKVTADFEKLQSDSQNRITDNVSLRAQLRDHSRLLEERDKARQGLNQEIKTLNTEMEEHKARCEKLEKEVAEKAALFRKLEEEAAAKATQCEKLEKEVATKAKRLRRLAIELASSASASAADKLKLEQQLNARTTELATIEEQLAASHTQDVESAEELAQQAQVEQYQLEQQLAIQADAMLKLEQRINAQIPSYEDLVKQLAQLRTDYSTLEQQKKRFEDDLPLKIKSFRSRLGPLSDPVVLTEMMTLEQRIRDEEAKKHDAEIAKLRAEITSMFSETSKRKGDAATSDSPARVSSRRSSKRRHDELADTTSNAEKRACAEELVETFFGPDGVCKACR